MTRSFTRHSSRRTRSSCSIGILVVVSIGGLVQIAPLFYLESTIEKVKGMRPYTPLELAGRNIYVREGCYLPQQMVRTAARRGGALRPLQPRAESMYDHPFQWGSKRTGWTLDLPASAASIPTNGIATCI
jgi:cytochrome c oxidase cbb3-type subunit 2